MILLYLGKGKGKTSACLGQALRALGHGEKVAFGQFIKRDGQAGEQQMLHSLPGLFFRAGGLGFVKDTWNLQPHLDCARDLLSWAEKMLPKVFVLILDEALYALEYGLIQDVDLARLLQLAQSFSTHLVLSGRSAPEWLRTSADLVTECVEVKHPLKAGQRALRGIDF